MATINCVCKNETININEIQKELYDIQLQNHSSKKIIKMLLGSLKKKLEYTQCERESKQKVNNFRSKCSAYEYLKKKVLAKESVKEKSLAKLFKKTYPPMLLEMSMRVDALDLEFIKVQKKSAIDSNVSLPTEELLELLDSESEEMIGTTEISSELYKPPGEDKELENKAEEVCKILQEILANLRFIDENINILAKSLHIEISTDYLNTEASCSSSFELSDQSFQDLDYVGIVELYELNKEVLCFIHSKLMVAQKKMGEMKENKWFEFSELMKFIKKRHDNLVDENELLNEIIRNVEDCNGNLIKNDHTRFVDQ